MTDEEMDATHERREALVRRACRVMGWNYHTSPAFSAIRKVALADAVAVGLDKLAAMLDEIDRLKMIEAALCKASNTSSSEERFGERVSEEVMPLCRLNSTTVHAALEQARKDTEAIRKAERAGESISGETMEMRLKGIP